MHYDLSHIHSKELVKGFYGKYIHSDNTSIGFVDIEEGCILPVHAHVHEQTTIVLEGQLEITIGSETKVYEKGLVAFIPSNIHHSARALTACKVMDVFYPVREDYK